MKFFCSILLISICFSCTNNAKEEISKMPFPYKGNFCRTSIDGDDELKCQFTDSNIIMGFSQGDGTWEYDEMTIIKIFKIDSEHIRVYASFSKKNFEYVKFELKLIDQSNIKIVWGQFIEDPENDDFNKNIDLNSIDRLVKSFESNDLGIFHGCK